jgi:hypothetical protein
MAPDPHERWVTFALVVGVIAVIGLVVLLVELIVSLPAP